jgi:hypothetical protein
MLAGTGLAAGAAEAPMADELDPKQNENEEMGRSEDDVRERADDEEFEDIDEDEGEEDETDNLPS